MCNTTFDRVTGTLGRRISYCIATKATSGGNNVKGGKDKDGISEEERIELSKDGLLDEGFGSGRLICGVYVVVGIINTVARKIKTKEIRAAQLETSSWPPTSQRFPVNHFW